MAEQHVSEYEAQGFTIYKNVIDESLLQEVRQHVEWLKRKHPEKRPENLNETLAHGDPFWLRLVSDPRLLDIAEQYVGSDIALFQSHYICKEPRDGQVVLWHQDGKGWPVDPKDPMITIWLAVTDSDDENGCVRIIPGTQHDDWHEQVEGNRGNDVVFGRTIPGYRTPGQEERAVSVILKAGDVSVHSSRSVHGSEANTSDRQRCGLTISYMPATSRLVAEARPEFEGGWPSLYLLRGKPGAWASDGDVTFAPWPTFIDGEHMPFREANPPYVLGTPRL